MSDITMNEIVSATRYVHRRTLRLTVSIIRDYEVCKMVDRLLLHLHDKTIHEVDEMPISDGFISGTSCASQFGMEILYFKKPGYIRAK